MNMQRIMDVIDACLDQNKPDCPEGCHSCCCAVLISPREAVRLGLPPDAGTTGWDENDDCKFLKDGRCSVYEKRPTLCRVFGCAEKGLFACGKLKGKPPTIPQDVADNILEVTFIEAVGEGMAPPSIEMIESCARHDTREGLRKSSEDVVMLKEMVEHYNEGDTL